LLDKPCPSLRATCRENFSGMFSAMC
jgi:hypothetical protein